MVWEWDKDFVAHYCYYSFFRVQIVLRSPIAMEALAPCPLSLQASMAWTKPASLSLRPSYATLSTHRSLGLLRRNSALHLLGAGGNGNFCTGFANPFAPKLELDQKRHLCVHAASTSRSPSQPRFIQHKLEAFWFYRFLSIVYDHIINPGHWTVDMREDALEPANLNDPDLVVVDVGGGTGFCTQGIVKHVNPKNVTILDQSPHQLAKAREKEDLKGCTIVEGDAEDLPFATDSVDRYVSAGSIEYWPDPQRGIREAYRVLKRGGKACLIGPVHPTFWLSSFFADVWMLFPTEEEYMEWFSNAGFVEVRIKRIGPKWYRGVRRHGLIMGCSVTGIKPNWGDSPLKLGPKAEDVKAKFNPLVFLYRFLIGVMASIYYVLVPVYMWIKDQIVPKGQPI